MTPTVVLHIGTMKSGSTYLQGRLDEHRERLAQDGVLFPGERWSQQMRAAGDALRQGAGNRARAGGPWQRMVDEMLAWDGQLAIVSVEHLCRAGAGAVRFVVESLRPAHVQVVVTVRDLARSIPSMWQQHVKGGGTVDFATYVAQLVGDGHAASARKFWQRQDVAEHVRRWGAVVGPDQVYVIAVPPSGSEPDLLWQRFAATIGLDPARYPPGDADLPLNPSVGAAGAEVLRLLNVRLGQQIDRPQHRHVVKRMLANSLLAGRAVDLPASIPVEAWRWVVARSERLVDELEASHAHLVGSAQDLLADPGPVIGPARGPGSGLLVDAAVTAAGGLVRDLADREATGRAVEPARAGTLLDAHRRAAERRSSLVEPVLRRGDRRARP